MKKIILPLILITNTVFAGDATQANELNFTPNPDSLYSNKLENIKERTKILEDNSVDIKELAGIAKGTRDVLINKEGCVYNLNFDCTEDNLTYKYKTTNHTKLFTSGSSFSWTTPEGVDSINVIIRGGPMTFYLSYVGRGGSEENCIAGSSTMFNGVIAIGGDYTGYQSDFYTCSKSRNADVVYRTFSAVSGQVFTGNLKIGKYIGRSRYWHYRLNYGSVLIQYTKNLRIK